MLDHGTDSTEPVDYPPICAAVGRTVRDGDAELGIVVGGSGQGEQIAANKVRGVRAALCNDLYTARMARAHNDANVLSMGARVVGARPRRGHPRHVPHHRLRRWPARPPRRPDRRPRSRVLTLRRITPCRSRPTPSPTPRSRRCCGREFERQTTGLQLIASENFTSPAVLRAVGSVLTNKYSEGYPGRRYYGGNAVIDDVEALAIERAKALFGAEHANVQPHSGANANMCVYQALLQPGDTVLGLSLDHGGHLTHGSPVNASGLLYHFVAYKVTPGDERIDFDQVRDLALEHRPKMIVAGTTSYPRRLDPEPFRAIADEVGAVFMFDAAHLAGLIVGGAHPDPVPVRRRRHVDDAQDPARAAWRLHPRQGGVRQGDRQGRVPGLAGRPARARHRRQGGRVPRGRPPVVQGVRPPDRASTPRRSPRRWRGRGSGSCPAARTTT